MAVRFSLNGGNSDQVMVCTLELNRDTDSWEYWFQIGTFYKSMKTAIRAAVKNMAKYGYTLNNSDLEKLS